LHFELPMCMVLYLTNAAFQRLQPASKLSLIP